MSIFRVHLLVFVVCLTTANCYFNFGRLHALSADRQTPEAGALDGQRFASALEKVQRYATTQTIVFRTLAQALGAVGKSEQRFFNEAVHVHANGGHMVDASSNTSSNSVEHGRLFVVLA